MPRRIVRVVADGSALMLDLTWATKARTRVDLRPRIARGGVFARLADPKLFARARVVPGGFGVYWPGTEADCAADALWFETRPQDNPHPDAVMTGADFRGWMRANGYSLASAAASLGLGRRTVAYYASGEKAIPKVVFLACMALTRADDRPTRRRAA